MIKKINKNINNLKIGVLGSRRSCFSKILDLYGLNYVEIDNYMEIDNSYDIILESGVYEKIPEMFINMPILGFFGIHESPLPEGKGWAPIQWAVKNNRENLTVSFYKLNNKIDDGDIVCQYNVGIDPLDTLEEINAKRLTGISECFKIFLDELQLGVIVLRKQSGNGSYHKKMTENDTELDIHKPLITLWDKIRVCDNDKFPAFFIINDQKVIIKYYKT